MPSFSGRSRDRVYTMLSAVLVIVAALATDPWLEMGTNDDWSYTWVARDLAATGHFIFNGWIGAIIGIQAVWAALLVRIFGFSFTLVRLSTLPFAAGCSILLYRLGRYTGLNPHFALFGVFSITLSPVFIPLSASFMTDVPGFFFWLASAYCALRASENGSVRWMALAALCGILGGTVRQVVWFVPLGTLPVVAWFRRKNKATVIWAAVFWGISALSMGMCLRWFAAQPYTAAASVQETEPWMEIIEETVETFVQIGVACLLLMLPVLALFVAAWRKWLRTPLALLGGLLVSGTLLAGLWWFDDRLLLGNIITPTGILGSLDLLGVKPEILPSVVRILLGAALFLTTGVTVATLRPASSQELSRFACIYAPPCLVYTLAIVYRSVTDWMIFERYMILLLPLLVIPLLWQCQHRVKPTPPAWGWAVLAVVALFGIALTHDYLAAGRARLQAANTVTGSGIPRTQVSAGLEYDGWTQLETTGHIPLTDELAVSPHRRYPVSPPFWFWAKTPAVNPVYVLTYSSLPGLHDSQFPPVPYATWLPPFRREILTQHQ